MELVDKDSEQWYCAKDALVLYAKENRVVENVKLDLKKNTSEQVTGKLESGAPATREPVLSGKGTKFCRECGARIPRDSMYCKECGKRLV